MAASRRRTYRDSQRTGRSLWRGTRSGSGTNNRARTGRVWAARILVLVVFAINVLCAVQFIISPEHYVAAYQVEGAASTAIVRSIGICFLMWNATYPPVIARPQKHRVLFGVVIAQQVIGLVGESMLLASLGPGLDVLASSIQRFIAFDAGGLVLLVIAFILARPATART